jgi:hypothetical protein
LIASARRLQNQQLRAAIITDIKILHVRKIALRTEVSKNHFPTLPEGVMHCISHRTFASDTAVSAEYCA